jgi:hypothetical protein
MKYVSGGMGIEKAATRLAMNKVVSSFSLA